MQKLKELRKKNNYTQSEIAEKLGISQQAYAVYETKDRELGDDLKKKISEIYHIGIEELESKSTTYAPKGDMMVEEFLDSSKSMYHSTKNIESILKANGFERMYDFNKWELKEGMKGYVIKNNSAVIAFVVGDMSDYAFNIAECHTDSPCLKIKGNTLIDSPVGKRIDVEKYGGLIEYSMLDIPLKIAGRVIENQDGSLKSRVITSNFNVNIPSLCIHHNPTVNEGVNLNPQNDMLPLLGNVKDLYETLSNGNEIIDSDLYVTSDVKPYRSGADESLLVSPRLDNLTSAYSIVKAITKCEPKGVAIGAFFDNEEVGSHTKQGAASSFLVDTLVKINRSLGKTEDDFEKAKRNGFALSIDNGHSIHPAHPEKYDTSASAYLNKGVVIKHHTNYATDGVSSAVVKMICRNNDIECQEYYNRSDIRCGSTIGLVTSAQLEMNVCDIGLAQLAMHSAIETVGYKDIMSMERLVKAFYNTPIIFKEDEEITL